MVFYCNFVLFFFRVCSRIAVTRRLLLSNVESQAVTDYLRGYAKIGKATRHLGSYQGFTYELQTLCAESMLVHSNTILAAYESKVFITSISFKAIIKVMTHASNYIGLQMLPNVCRLNLTTKHQSSHVYDLSSLLKPPSLIIIHLRTFPFLLLKVNGYHTSRLALYLQKFYVNLKPCYASLN